MTFEIVKAEEKDYELFASIIQEVYEAMEEKEWKRELKPACRLTV